MEADPFEVLSQDVWFAHLPVELQDRLRYIALSKKVKAGTRIFSKGDQTNGVYALVSGSIKVMSELEPGQDNTLTQLQPPVWFGEVGLFDGLCRTHHVEAIVDSVLIFLPSSLLLRLLEERPAYWRHFTLLIAQKLRIAFMALDELAKTSIAVRIARRLVFMSMGLGDQTIRHVIEIHQETLAQMMGLSRTSINPILRQLSSDGIIRLAYGRIEILDMTRLKRVAGHEYWPPTVPLKGRGAGKKNA